MPTITSLWIRWAGAAAVLLVALSGLPVAQAQVGKNTDTNVVADDQTPAFLLLDNWKNGQLPGTWKAVSTQGAKTVKELVSLGLIFGERPVQVQATHENGAVSKLQINYLEAGTFFGFRASEEAKYKDADAKGAQARAKARELGELKKKEAAELAPKRLEFAKRFKELETAIPAAIFGVTKAVGKRVSVGRDLLRTRTTEFVTDSLAMRFMAEEGQLIAVTIISKDGLTRRMLGDTKGRSTGIKEQVTTSENGDVVINNVPMVNQGSRGYCAIGTLAMITQYYGLDVNIDQLASKAGYKEGEVSNAAVIPIYEAASKAAKLRMVQQEKFDFRDAMRAVSKGKPLLVWRYFSRERDDFHSKFAARHLKDPAENLPNPRKDKDDRKLWPTFDSGGHASLITGYNKERGEVLFTESWGENNRNRRMKAEEMEATAYVVFEFQP